MKRDRSRNGMRSGIRPGRTVCLLSLVLLLAFPVLLLPGLKTAADDVYFPDVSEIGDFADTRAPRVTLDPSLTEEETADPKVTTEAVTEPYAIDYVEEYAVPAGLILLISLMILLIAFLAAGSAEKKKGQGKE